jgi:hypothetical protein
MAHSEIGTRKELHFNWWRTITSLTLLKTFEVRLTIPTVSSHLDSLCRELLAKQIRNLNHHKVSADIGIIIEGAPRCLIFPLWPNRLYISDTFLSFGWLRTLSLDSITV